MRKFYFPVLLSFFVITCTSDEQVGLEVTDNIEITEPQVSRDLEQIKEEGVLRAIMVYSSTSYFFVSRSADGI